MSKFASLLVHAFLLLFSAGYLFARAELLDRIVAVVDDEIILWSELNFRLRITAEQEGLSTFGESERLAALREELLESMIDEQVLLLKAERDSIAIDEGKVDEILREQYGTIKRNLGSDGLKTMLDRAGLTERQLRSRYRKEIRHSLLYQEMLRHLAFRLHITHKEIEAFREHHANSLPERLSVSRIKVKLKPDSTALKSQLGKLATIKKELTAGESFESLARQYSEDPGTASEGGNLGCFGTGQLVPPFEEAAFQLKPGETSEPVLTRYGYHIIRLHEKREDALCASHILLRSSITDEDRQRATEELLALRQRAWAGEDFSQLAREHSEEPQTAMRGGFWEVVPRDQIPPFLAPHVENLNLGDISEPFFLEEGGFIVKINDDQSTLESLIRENRLSESMRETVDEFKTKIHVDKRLNESEPGDGAS
jgi:peptidyl-prolyl cis-trans isomerase SurA